MKSGEFLKKKKKYKNIQHNRDQLKLLKEGKILEAELFVLDIDAFKKVTIAPLGDDFYTGQKVVFLFRRGRGSRLRTGYLYKDGFGCLEEPGTHIKSKYVFGKVIKEESLIAYEE